MGQRHFKDIAFIPVTGCSSIDADFKDLQIFCVEGEGGKTVYEGEKSGFGDNAGLGFGDVKGQGDVADRNIRRGKFCEMIAVFGGGQVLCLLVCCRENMSVWVRRTPTIFRVEKKVREE